MGTIFFFSSIICKDQKKEKLMTEMVNYWSSTVNDDLFYMMIKISIDIYFRCRYVEGYCRNRKLS